MAFADITEDNIQDLLTNKDSKETKRQLDRAVMIFRYSLLNIYVTTELESLSKSEINEHLRTFYASIKKTDAELMKKTYLTALKYGLGKFLKDTRKIDFKDDSEFASSNTVYAAVITDMKHKGFAAVEHKPAICPEDFVKLYDVTNVALIPNTPTGLLNNV